MHNDITKPSSCPLLLLPVFVLFFWLVGYIILRLFIGRYLLKTLPYLNEWDHQPALFSDYLSTNFTFFALVGDVIIIDNSTFRINSIAFIRIICLLYIAMRWICCSFLKLLLGTNHFKDFRQVFTALLSRNGNVFYAWSGTHWFLYTFIRLQNLYDVHDRQHNVRACSMKLEKSRCQFVFLRGSLDCLYAERSASDRRRFYKSTCLRRRLTRLCTLPLCVFWRLSACLRSNTTLSVIVRQQVSGFCCCQ